MTRPLRVLMVCARFLPDLGGIETVVNEVSQRLNRGTDIEATVLTTDRTGERAREDVVDGTRVIRVPAYPKSKDYYLAPGIPRVVAQPDAWDVIHIQGIHTPVPVTAMLAALRSAIPFAVTFHTGGHSIAYRNRLRPLQWRAISPLLTRSDQLIGVSRFEATSVADMAGIDPSRVEVIRNGGGLPLQSDVAIDPTLIISSGRLERYKGHQRVIEALPLVRAQVPDAHLDIIGGGVMEPELRQLADTLGVADAVRIRQIPMGDRNDMARTLSGAGCFISMSDYEAHPVAVMEAISLGLPVVASDIAGNGELVDLGWADGVDPAAPAPQVAAAIVAALRRAEQPRTVRELPTWDTCAEAYAEVYRRIARPRG